MRYYELTCLGELSSLHEKVSLLIKEQNGILTDVYKKANVAVFNFEMAPENLLEFEKKLKSQIPRYLILAKDSKKASGAPQRTQVLEKSKQKAKMSEIEKKLEEILRQ